MASYHESQAEQEEPEGGLWSRFGRWTNRWSGAADNEEEEEEHHGAKAYRTPPRRDTFRIASAREGSICVMPVASFGDIQKAADRLKAGEPQIVNLENTPAEVSERLIDFLNGVTYALEGYVEKISEGAYLFTPSHIAIHADGPEPPQPKSPFFDR